MRCPTALDPTLDGLRIYVELLCEPLSVPPPLMDRVCESEVALHPKTIVLQGLLVA